MVNGNWFQSHSHDINHHVKLRKSHCFFKISNISSLGRHDDAHPAGAYSSVNANGNAKGNAYGNANDNANADGDAHGNVIVNANGNVYGDAYGYANGNTNGNANGYAMPMTMPMAMPMATPMAMSMAMPKALFWNCFGDALGMSWVCVGVLLGCATSYILGMCWV